MFKSSMTTDCMAPQAAGKFVSRTAPRLALLGVLALAIPTGFVALSQGVGGLALPYNLHVVDQRLPGIFRLHMLASGLALLLIPLAIYAGLRRPGWHRALGRLAALCVVAGALTALPVAISSESVAMARAGFFAQGIVWLSLLIAGVRAIRERRVGDHMRFMLAMAGVATGAIWVRMTTTAATAWDLPFDALYASAAWAGWMVPMWLAWALGTRLLAPARAVV
jgi:hypothetical protein